MQGKKMIRKCSFKKKKKKPSQFTCLKKFDIFLPKQFRKQIPAKIRQEQAFPSIFYKLSCILLFCRRRKVKDIIFCAFLFCAILFPSEELMKLATSSFSCVKFLNKK